MTAALMIQGTGSHVGKSLLVAALARAWTQRGLKVRPFKPQNMSNNAGVAADGGEIGRAQMLQARACGTPPSHHMNPVLLKPQSDRGAQLVVHGRVAGSFTAGDYPRMKPRLLAPVLESFKRLAGEADLVLVEGAGSPAEVNLREDDIANMGFARAAGVPAVLVGDAERGGAIAAAVGTVALLGQGDRRLLRGFCINRFRGDPALFQGALDDIRQRTRLPCLGVVPHIAAARRLPEEDSAALDSGLARRPAPDAAPKAAIRIAVPRFARIANSDDLDPLVAEDGVAVTLVAPGEALPGDADLVILPGSKNTLADLAAFRAQGWDIDLAAHMRRGGWVLGLCGGYQMLGRQVADPDGIEGAPGSAPGLGLLEIRTTLTGDKRLVETTGHDSACGERVAGYEMHMGVSDGPDCARPMLRLAAGADGAVSRDGRAMGCYLHGLFAADGFRRRFLERIAGRAHAGPAFEAGVEAALDEVAASVARSLDLDRLLEIARERR